LDFGNNSVNPKWNQYTNQNQEKEILAHYNQKLNELETEYEYKLVDTDYGKTNIIIVEGSKKPTIMVVHGSNGCAPIALETYPTLHKEFQVFAIDVLAQPNKSAETRLSMKDNSYALWINDLINQLELKNISRRCFYRYLNLL
jgi:hypothetical protein